ncbi:hypothetical protein M2132_002285 [Dysgonomonas sp. PH5-45]|uniref:hypothetical protein n=1 Tax=unclassified Dysgonomonas TaxID=2630389 RepID=UPI0024752014|nr:MULTISPECIES: hypothetical protein [unclassified Dysgonomonas]MDH6355934.1 hypothetical protein [Dysgonomonas sp. PH5-45]MDH6388829.1 hypothetical protein [Dysgonomonas sp. PH5-37]
MIHIFNPGHENAVQNASPYYMPPANVAIMQRELAFLPAWYAQEGDFVFVPQSVDEAFFRFLQEKLNLNVHPFSVEDVPAIATQLRRQSVCLWGISPQAINQAEELSAQSDLGLVIPHWNDTYKELCSRETSRRFLQEIIGSIQQIQKEILPITCHSLEEIETLVEGSPHQLLAKAPYSSSGRGLLWLPVGRLTRTERQILHGMLKKQQTVTLEKVLNKQTDFAMEFLINENKEVIYEGLSLFQTNKRGAYLGNTLARQDVLLNKISEKIDVELLLQTQNLLTKLISNEIAPYYTGCVGVDMMVYEDGGLFRLHPCLEINIRYNMGYLSLKLFEKYIDSLSTGIFKIDFSAKQDVYKQHQNYLETYPPIVQNGKISEGYLPLCPISENNKYHSYILIKKNHIV